MRKKAKHLTVYLIVLSVLCMLASCSQMQTRRMYEGRIRSNAEVVRLQVPDSIRVLSINGQATQEAFIEILGHEMELHLLPGEHAVEMRYQRTWDNEAYGIERVKSELFTMTLSGNAGEAYEVRLKDKIENSRQSKAFAANPQIEIVRTGKVSAAPASIMADTVDVTLPRSTRDAEPTTSPPATISATPEATTAVPKTAAPSSNLERLRQAWENASPQEQDAFIKSILKR